MNQIRRRVSIRAGAVAVALAVGSVSSCSTEQENPESASGGPLIVVSNTVLATVTAEIAGTDAQVVVLIPNGVDPHVYEPSAKDIEILNSADLVVINGLGLEERLEDSLEQVRSQRIPIFEATDHIQLHEVSTDGHDDADHGSSDHDRVNSGETKSHQHDDADPHFWTDPRRMADVVEELGDAITDLGLDIGDRALMLSERLLTFDQDMLAIVERLPAERRVLVTGHESLGYFAERYGFEIVATILPGLTSGAEVSAENLVAVKEAVDRASVGVIFTELGTPSASARVLSDELGVDVVEISTHFIPEEALQNGMNGESYMTFIETLVETIVSSLTA